MRKFILLVLVSVLLTSTLTGFVPTAKAATFNPNRIMDDGIFDKYASMTPSQIDSWLNQFPYSCISPNSGFQALDPTGYNPTAGFQYGGWVTAGQVIVDAANAYNINPQVLLATLQKEQSLVQGGSSYCNDGNENKYAAAVGYGCPDGGTTYAYTGVDLYMRNGVAHTTVTHTCVNSSKKVGFTQQVIRAAWLLKFSEERSEGKTGWAVVKTNWDNSDDLQSCYSGPMTQGTFARCPSGGAAYYDGYTTIDNTAVHMDTGPTAALYWYTPHFHGNQNFFDIFQGWFGDTTLPTAITAGAGQTVYIQTDGYKFSVPSMALLQDYGIEPSAIQVVSQSTIDSIATPDTSSTNLSTGVSYLVKSQSDTDADGGTVYLISVGKRYGITSMTQLSDFGFNTANISYLPLSYIYSLSDGGNLSNYVYTPTHNVFQVSGGSKRIIFDSSTYQSLNPSGAISGLSGYTASLTPSGAPIANKPIVVGLQNGSDYLLDNDSYYAIPSMNVYDCWGFSQALNTTLYRVADDSYIGSFSPTSKLGCFVNAGSSNNYLLNGSNKIPVPASYNLNGQPMDSNLSSLSNGLPARGELGRITKTGNQATVWYNNNGTLRPIPSMSDLSLLGFTGSQIDSIQPGALNSLPVGNIILGNGQLIKGASYGAVYIVDGNQRVPFMSIDDLYAYNYGNTPVETFDNSVIDPIYPASSRTIQKYLYDQSSQNVFLMDRNGCYNLNSSQLSSYGKSVSAVQSAQSYVSTALPYINLTKCASGSVFVKTPDSSTVYWIDGGQKHPISSWNSLVKKSGTSNPYIITLSQSTLNTLTDGTSV